MTRNKSNEAGDKPTPTISFGELSPESQALFRKLRAKSKIVENYQKTYFGNTPPIVSVEAFGRRMVAIRGKIVHSDDPNYDWKTPSDFLVSYLKSKLGINWLNQEFQNKFRDQHEVAKWYMKGVPNFKNENDNNWLKPNGKALALLHLAYDLFILDHVGKLPDFLIDRLRAVVSYKSIKPPCA